GQMRPAAGSQPGYGGRVQEGHRHQGTPGPAVRRPVPPGGVGQRGDQQGPPLGLEPRTRQGPTGGRPGRPETPRTTTNPQPTTPTGPGPLGQALPLGAAQGPRCSAAL